GQVTGQQALALVTIPTATLAALPGLTPAAPAGAIFKPPVANLTASVSLGTVPASVSPGQHSIFSFPVQDPSLFLRARSWPQFPQGRIPVSVFLYRIPLSVSPDTIPASVSPGSDPVSVPQLTAALGVQPQILGTLSAPPVISNPLPSVQGIPGQLLTNTQGQVPRGVPCPPPRVVSPGEGPLLPQRCPMVTPSPSGCHQLSQWDPWRVELPVPPQVTLESPQALRSPPGPPQVQPIQPAPAGVGTSPVAKVSPSPVPITCSETPTVSQLVSMPGNPWEEGTLSRVFGKRGPLQVMSPVGTGTPAGNVTCGDRCGDSATCRFEKLDITPKSAQKLKPVLEKWLREAEQRQREGQQHLLEFVGGEPGKKRKRRTSFTPQALEALNAHFERNALPTGAEIITRIAQELRYEREVVRVWFCNRRQTLKNTSKLNVFHVP
ncbi:PO6F1 factor, partial [Leucopsar rothschildi]|nr:PO6F1 factor [Leucopsar rothschildi]